jgi:hypothetical protein
MDEIENKTSDQTDSADLQMQFDSLRHYVLSVLILVIVVTGALNIYLYYQFKAAGRELETARPMVQNLVSGYNRGDGPALEKFVRDSMEYGRTHPDFGPYLDKYGLRPPPGMAIPPPGAGPAPKAPPAAPAPVPAKK